MTVYLVRHGLASDEHEWEQPDDVRPLTPAGREQARGLVDLLADVPVTRILSSPRPRCVQTVEPLAEERDLPIEHADPLDQGPVDADAAIELMLATADGEAVHCSHREVISEVMPRLADAGLALDDGLRWAKGSTWVLESEAGRFVRSRYLPPPGVDD